MTQNRYKMNLSSIVALFVLGCAAFVGLGMLLRAAFPQFIDQGIPILGLVTVLAVVLVLFVFGFFFGYFYCKTDLQWKADERVLRRFRDALDFERQERMRLERELLESKRRTVNLEDRLSREGSKYRETEALTAAEREQREKMRVELETLMGRQENMREDLNKRKERIADLMAELSVAQSDAEAARSEARELKESLTKPQPTFIGDQQISGTTVKEVLEGVVKLEGIKMALVADDYGLVVDSVGDELPSETLAAISSLIASIGPRVREILPMGEVATVSLGDDEGLVLETRYFELFGTQCALSIARDDEHPYPGLTARLVDSIKEGFKD